MVKIMKELSRNVSLLTKDNSRVHEHVTAEASGLEHNIMEALSPELGGTVVKVGYEYLKKMSNQCGDVDGIIQHKNGDQQYIVICEVKTNVDKNYKRAVAQLRDNFERWKRFCKIPESLLKEDIGFVEPQEECQLSPSKHDIKDAQALRVIDFKDAKISFAIGGICDNQLDRRIS
jgi:hypothetical protein